MRETQTTSFVFKLPRDLLERLRAESGKRGITVAGFIRMILLKELEEK